MKPKSEFSRNVLTLMTGTTIAQAIPIAISPILTRIYTPEDFGVFALYFSLSSILAVVVTGRYELAIMLPKKNENAFHIMVLSLLMSLLISLLLFGIVFAFNSELTALFGNNEISSWLYFIPITTWVLGSFRSFNYWNNRNKYYKQLAGSRVLQSGTTAVSNLGMGALSFGSSGLILGTLLGQSVATYILGSRIWKENKDKLEKLQKLKLLALAKKYIQFPKFDVLTALLNVSSHQLPHLLFNLLLNSTTAGYYYLAQRVISLPISFLSSAVADVFKEEASKVYAESFEAKKIYIATLKKLVYFSLFPSLLLYIYSEDIFKVVFGEEWAVAGYYVRILVPMLLLRFIVSPLSFMLYIGGKQKLNLYGQFLFLLAVLISFLFAETAEAILMILSSLFSLVYLYYLYVSAKIAQVI